MRTWISIVFTLLFLTNKGYCQEDYPSPTNKTNLLFYIQHDRGKNTCVYNANLTRENIFVKNNPVKIYRELFDEGGKIKELSYIQRTFAYGVDATRLDDRSYEIALAALPKQKIKIYLDKSNRPIAETNLNGNKIILDRIFLKHVEGTSGISTKIEYILFYGKGEDGRPSTRKLTL